MNTDPRPPPPDGHRAPSPPLFPGVGGGSVVIGWWEAGSVFICVESFPVG